jgi:hypothetical protein
MLEIFMQFRVMNLSLTINDFIPFVGEEGIDKQPWYDRRLFYGRTPARQGAAPMPDPMKECSYDSIRNAFKNMFDSLDPKLKNFEHVLHLARGVSARMCESNGVSAAQIGCGGCWKAPDAMNQSYLIGIAMEVLWHLAGFDKDIGDFFVVQNLLILDESLWKRVIPVLQELKDAIGTPFLPKDKVCGTSYGFMEFLEKGSIIFLQHAAVLYDKMRVNTPCMQSAL